MSNTDKVFAGSIPKLYDTYLVPLIFEPYATDLANRLTSRSVTRVLEIAAGTGVVTRAVEWHQAMRCSCLTGRNELRPYQETDVISS